MDCLAPDVGPTDASPPSASISLKDAHKCELSVGKRVQPPDRAAFDKERDKLEAEIHALKSSKVMYSVI